MPIDWVEIASKLLASNNPVTATAGAIKSVADVVHDFTKDDPIKQAKADKAIEDSINEQLKNIKEAENAEELIKSTADLHNNLGK